MFSAVYLSVLCLGLLRLARPGVEPDTTPVRTRQLRDPLARAGEKKLSFVAETFDQVRQRGAVQLGVHIVHYDGKPLVPLPFYLCQGGEPQRCRQTLRLSRAEYISNAPAASFQTQIMAVWTIDGEPHLAVSRPGLIIALSVQIFHLFRPTRRPTPGF